MNIEEIISSCKKEAKEYDRLYTVIDWISIRKQLAKNSKLFISQNKSKALNLVESLLRPNFGINSVFDFKANLKLLDESLNKIWTFLSENDKKRISSKISNLSNTSFWDTSVELWLAKELMGNNRVVKLEYPLLPKKKDSTPPNVDLAILDKSNEPKWFIECISPTLDNGFEDLELNNEENLILEPERATYWILFNLNKKFHLKFEPYMHLFPNTKIAIVISVIKADEISAHLSDITNISSLPIKINTKTEQFHPRLTYGTAIRFQNINDKPIPIRLLEYGRP